MNMSKSGKSAHFRHVFAINFFVVNFFKLFQQIWNQREIRGFLYIKFLKNKIFFAPFSIFSNECLSRQPSLIINIVGTDDICRLPRRMVE